MATKAYRQAVVWVDDNNIHAYYVSQNESGSFATPEVVIEYITRETGWRAIGDDKKEKFILDAQRGLVTVASGYNVKAEDDNQWKVGDLYSRDMHSVNNFSTDMERVKTIDGWRGYGWCYKVVKERPLNDSELNVIKKCQDQIKHNKEIDKIYYLVSLLLSKGSHIKHSSLGTGNFGRVTSYMEFDTRDCFTYQSAQNKVKTIQDSVSMAYNTVVKVTGQKLLKNDIELPEVFISSRYMANKDFVVSPAVETKDMATIYQELLQTEAIHKFITKSIKDYKYIPSDDSVIVMGNLYTTHRNAADLTSHHITSQHFLDVPDCIVIGDEKCIDFVIVWGSTKAIVEALGINNFIKYIATKQN
jgi:hypothetical protein